VDVPYSVVTSRDPIAPAGWVEASQFLSKPDLEAGANRDLAKAAWHAEAWVGTPAPS
jgi:hypothetical protein